MCSFFYSFSTLTKKNGIFSSSSSWVERDVVLFSWKKCNLFAYIFFLQSNISFISKIYLQRQDCCCVVVVVVCWYFCFLLFFFLYFNHAVVLCANVILVVLRCYSINSFKQDSWHKLKIGKWINRKMATTPTTKTRRTNYFFSCATIESLFIVLVMRKICM